MSRLDKLLAKTSLDPDTGCILWKSRIGRGGYGYYKLPFSGKLKAAHRAVWEATYAPLRKYQEVHHTCGVRNCVNVDHLMIVDQKQHALIHDQKQHKAATAKWAELGVTYHSRINEPVREAIRKRRLEKADKAAARGEW